jgi:quercetin dioxygenase-like cupin family protein
MQTLVRHRDEGTATWFLNGLVTTKATNDETGGGFGIAEHLVTAASNPPVHVHTDEEESFYVLDGEVEVEVDGVVTTARAGTFALVPRGARHTFRVLTDTARLLVITSAPGGATNGGFEDFVRSIGSPATARVLPEPQAPDPVALTVAAAAHGIEILPPA